MANIDPRRLLIGIVVLVVIIGFTLAQQSRDDCDSLIGEGYDVAFVENLDADACSDLLKAHRSLG